MRGLRCRLTPAAVRKPHPALPDSPPPGVRWPPIAEIAPASYCIATPLALLSARVAGCGAARDAQKWLSGPFGGVATLMKTTKALAHSDSGPRLLSVTQYLEKNFPDFF